MFICGFKEKSESAYITGDPRRILYRLCFVRVDAWVLSYQRTTSKIKPAVPIVPGQVVRELVIEAKANMEARTDQVRFVFSY